MAVAAEPVLPPRPPPPRQWRTQVSPPVSTASFFSPAVPGLNADSSFAQHLAAHIHLSIATTISVSISPLAGTTATAGTCSTTGTTSATGTSSTVDALGTTVSTASTLKTLVVVVLGFAAHVLVIVIVVVVVSVVATRTAVVRRKVFQAAGTARRGHMVARTDTGEPAPWPVHLSAPSAPLAPSHGLAEGLRQLGERLLAWVGGVSGGEGSGRPGFRPVERAGEGGVSGREGSGRPGFGPVERA